MEIGNLNIRNLAELLRPPDEADNSSDDDLPPSGLAKLGPGSIGPKKKGSGEKVSGTDGGGDVAAAEDDPGAIWNAVEVPSTPGDDDGADPRPRPDYDMCFRQAVTPEDVFLQMGGRTPSTASCEELVVRVRLPGERMADVALQVTSARVDVRSPAFRLALPLPHTVDPDNSRASWDADAHTLTLTLRLVREFDYVNF